GKLLARGIFADMNEGTAPGIPDGLKVDSIGRVYCTGPGGIWVFTPDGKRVGIIRWPEQAVNFAFGGPDLRTLLCCAHTSLYTLRVKVPGTRHPWNRLRGGVRARPPGASRSGEWAHGLAGPSSPIAQGVRSCSNALHATLQDPFPPRR